MGVVTEQVEQKMLYKALSDKLDENTKVTQANVEVLTDIHTLLNEQATTRKVVKWIIGTLFTVWVAFKVEIWSMLEWLTSMGKNR